MSAHMLTPILLKFRERRACRNFAAAYRAAVKKGPNHIVFRGNVGVVIPPKGSKWRRP